METHHSGSPSDHLIPSTLVQEDPKYTTMVETFIKRLPLRLDEFQRALSKHDFDTLLVKAHQLKGAGGGFGYAILTEKAAELERHARQHARTDCQIDIDELIQMCSRLVISHKATSP